MPLITMIFWLVAVIVMIGGWWIAGGLTWLAHRRKWHVAKWLLGLIFVAFTVADLAVVFLLVQGWILSSSPTHVFENSFHEKPPPGMVMLHGESTWVFDSAGVDLSFRTDRATFDRLRPDHLEPILLKEYDSHNSLVTKKWWRAPTAKTEIWTSHGDGEKFHNLKPMEHNFSSESVFMTWDEDGLVQYLWEGND